MGEHIEKVIAGLLETDALTAREPSDGIYTVHEDDLDHLVRNVIDIDREQSEAEHTYTWADAAQALAMSTPLTLIEAADLVYPLDGLVHPEDAVGPLSRLLTDGRDRNALVALIQAAVKHDREGR